MKCANNFEKLCNIMHDAYNCGYRTTMKFRLLSPRPVYPIPTISSLSEPSIRLIETNNLASTEMALFND